VKQLALAALALSIAAFAPSSSHPCRDLRAQVAQPVQDVAAYLETRPSLDSLSGPGCVFILQSLKLLPSGAQVARELGSIGVENTRSRCTTSVNSIRYSCTDPEAGPVLCLPQSYSYCGQWEFSMTNQPKYELAMELSTQIDIAYDKAQQLCGLAMNRDEAGADSAAKDLVSYLGLRVLPESEKLYELGCEDAPAPIR
jgi:hypothetical protein